MPNPTGPVGPCTPGTTLVYAVTCDQSGEGYGTPDWVDPTEVDNFFGFPEEVAHAPCVGCLQSAAIQAAPAVDPVACFEAGVRAYRQGLLEGLDLQKRPEAVKPAVVADGTP